MPLSNVALWQSLQAFEFDDPCASRPFSVRLARDNGWTLRQAQQAIDEYRRYVYLCAVSDKPICPSDEVDEVWHQHLCFTRSYWNDLCGKILGRPLHHEPSTGGHDQLAYHRDIYQQTLMLYEREFDYVPPRELWPDIDSRFDNLGCKQFSMGECLIAVRTLASSLASMVTRPLRKISTVGCLAVVPVLGVWWNPFDLKGQDFIGLYVGMLVAACVGAVVARWSILPRDDGGSVPELNPYEAAVLAGGETQACQVALAELVLSDRVQLSTTGTYLTAAGPAPTEGGLLGAIHYATASSGNTTVAQAIRAGQPQAARLSARLEVNGLVPTTAQTMRAHLMPAAILASVAAFGAIKVLVGIDRHKPVVILVMLFLVTLFAIGLCFIPIRRTSRGSRALDSLRREHRSHKSKAAFAKSEFNDKIWVLGLFGLSTLAVTTGLGKDLYQRIYPNNSGCGGTTSGCGSGGGAGGCGGGCGGCSG